ncbi:MAG: lactate utilization protein [Chloroflexi bacterium]|nr:lactate utilization protein [Chloroflexota bacterium]
MTSANMGIPSAEFLASVRDALGRADAPPENAYEPLTDDLATLENRAIEVRERIAGELPELSRRLGETAALRGWNVTRCAGVEETLDYVVSLARRLGATSVPRSEQSVFDDVPVDAALAGVGALCWPAVYDGPDSREGIRRRLADSSMGITGADYAIAETGSVIVLPRRGLSRLVSVVPPVHVAIVRQSDIIGTLDDLFALRRLEYHQNGQSGTADMGSYLNFITGPSRTADIEQTIVVGVHGPREVHMVLLDEE